MSAKRNITAVIHLPGAGSNHPQAKCPTHPSVWDTSACKKANTQISPVSSINLFFRIVTHKNNYQETKVLQKNSTKLVK